MRPSQPYCACRESRAGRWDGLNWAQPPARTESSAAPTATCADVPQVLRRDAVTPLLCKLLFGAEPVIQIVAVFSPALLVQPQPTLLKGWRQIAAFSGLSISAAQRWAYRPAPAAKVG